MTLGSESEVHLQSLTWRVLQAPEIDSCDMQVFGGLSGLRRCLGCKLSIVLQSGLSTTPPRAYDVLCNQQPTHVVSFILKRVFGH